MAFLGRADVTSPALQRHVLEVCGDVPVVAEGVCDGGDTVAIRHVGLVQWKRGKP